LEFLSKVFESESLDILTTKTDDLNIESNQLLNSEKEIYFICCLETKLDKQTKRGAILKSLSIGTTRLINLEIFKPVALYLLEEIFKIHTFNIKEPEKLDLIKNLIEEAYKSFNEINISK
jgi:hypothetical protein